jgi:transposase
VVCDNLKAGVIAAGRYEPGISRSYADMATHYCTAIVPARVRKPRDKAKVEVAVQLVQRWVLPSLACSLARLRHRRFFSLAELNDAISELIEVLNSRPVRHLGVSRRALFEASECSALLTLPTEPYVYAEWHRCRAGIDYHVEVYGQGYSVPSRLMRETIEARIAEQTVDSTATPRIASHIRSPLRGRHTTIAEHMPSAHRRYADWTSARLMREAAVIGPSTTALVEQILHAKLHPEQGFRASLGNLRLVRAWGAERVDASDDTGIVIEVAKCGG